MGDAEICHRNFGMAGGSCVVLGQVSPDEVESVLREGVEYYIESVLEPDFEQSDADLYEPLPLENVDENIGKLITKHERPAEVSEVCPKP